MIFNSLIFLNLYLFKAGHIWKFYIMRNAFNSETSAWRVLLERPAYLLQFFLYYIFVNS